MFNQYFAWVTKMRLPQIIQKAIRAHRTGDDPTLPPRNQPRAAGTEEFLGVDHVPRSVGPEKRSLFKHEPTKPGAAQCNSATVRCNHLDIYKAAVTSSDGDLVLCFIAHQ